MYCPVGVPQKEFFSKEECSQKAQVQTYASHKILVWAGISKRGATQLVMFEGIMIAIRYGDILSASLVPFLSKTYVS